ncbi:MAG TPA: hypothetical protein VK158_00200 [Acidobacteriota bacterium]|nr:hypothetical protein [Acidobacteriota bacterium]
MGFFSIFGSKKAATSPTSAQPTTGPTPPAPTVPQSVGMPKVPAAPGASKPVALPDLPELPALDIAAPKELPPFPSSKSSLPPLPSFPKSSEAASIQEPPSILPQGGPVLPSASMFQSSVKAPASIPQSTPINPPASLKNFSASKTFDSDIDSFIAQQSIEDQKSETKIPAPEPIMKNTMAGLNMPEEHEEPTADIPEEPIPEEPVEEPAQESTEEPEEQSDELPSLPELPSQPKQEMVLQGPVYCNVEDYKMILANIEMIRDEISQVYSFSLNMPALQKKSMEKYDHLQQNLAAMSKRMMTVNAKIFVR